MDDNEKKDITDDEQATPAVEEMGARHRQRIRWRELFVETGDSSWGLLEAATARSCGGSTERGG